MGDEILKLKTDGALLDALEHSVQKHQTVADRQEQRVSFVFGSLDAKNDMTRDRVRELLENA